MREQFQHLGKTGKKEENDRAKEEGGGKVYLRKKQKM
jgi:hypothetical protein